MRDFCVKGRAAPRLPQLLRKDFWLHSLPFFCEDTQKGAYSQKQAAKGELEVRMGRLERGVSWAGLGTGVPSYSGDTLQSPSVDHPDCQEMGEGQKLALGGWQGEQPVHRGWERCRWGAAEQHLSLPRIGESISRQRPRTALPPLTEGALQNHSTAWSRERRRDFLVG